MLGPIAGNRFLAAAFLAGRVWVQLASAPPHAISCHEVELPGGPSGCQTVCAVASAPAHSRLEVAARRAPSPPRRAAPVAAGDRVRSALAAGSPPDAPHPVAPLA